jgi:hypothetical protein
MAEGFLAGLPVTLFSTIRASMPVMPDFHTQCPSRRHWQKSCSPNGGVYRFKLAYERIDTRWFDWHSESDRFNFTECFAACR